MIITEIKSVAHFAELLRENPGKIIIKFGAKWCAPCKRIETQVYRWFDMFPEDTVQAILVDVDISLEFYTFMKSKRMVGGIPAIMCFLKGNTSYVPDHSVIGSDPHQIDEFFRRFVQ